MSEKLEKQGVLDRQIWYVAWVPWDNLVSLICWEFVGFAQEAREIDFLGQANLVCGMGSMR